MLGDFTKIIASKHNSVVLIFSFIFTSLTAQKITSGDYGAALQIAYDAKTNKLTGYYENYTGWHEQTNSPRFSCIFYIEGSVTANQFKIKTYSPKYTTDIIVGDVEIINSKNVSIKLPEEHGGCWNVEHFADEPVKFELTKNSTWIQIRYVTTEKTYFYSEKSEAKKGKAYLIKNDILFVDKIDGTWAYCSYIGKKITKGWIKTADLNVL